MRSVDVGSPPPNGTAGTSGVAEPVVPPTVSVEVAVPVPGVTCGGEKLHVVPLGSAPEHDRETGCSKLGPLAATLTVKEASWPAATATVSGAAATVKPEAMTH
jgi:hypothetical protein